MFNVVLICISMYILCIRVNRGLVPVTRAVDALGEALGKAVEDRVLAVGRLAEDPRVRFGERGVETEQATVSEAPATGAVGSRWTVAESPRHPPTLRR
jgi:hypothetical protein